MLERLEALAREADEGYTGAHPRDSDNWQANEAFCRAADPAAVLKLIAVVKAAQRKMAAYDVLANKPIGEFTGNEVVACDEADDALRGALAELERP